MASLLISFILLGLTGYSLLVDSKENFEIGFIIISQSNRHHNALADFTKNSILKQAKLFPEVKIRVFKSHQDFGTIIGHWTFLPLFKKLSNFLQVSWFFFLEDSTQINLKNLLNLFKTYNHSEDHFVGRALIDKDPTIIHHFDNPHDKFSISYPNFLPGFFLSFSLIKKLTSRCKDCSFSIDSKYELAKFILKSTGVKLENDSRLCLKKMDICASWVEGGLLYCGKTVSNDKVFVAVKTCEKFHSDRVKVIKNTWANEVHNLNFFSDVEDDRIPTVKLPVKNVPSGHCEKTLSILKFYVNNKVPLDWLAIVDDDTLLSFPRLQKLLSCYSSNEFVAIGERYGYNVVEGTGYDYLTGGSGFILSMPTVKQLVKSCRCPSNDSPDDMILGLCLKNMNIPVVHSPLFHQARPTDYSEDMLSSLKHISFHKYWMIDPYLIYKVWLKEINHSEHSEL